MLLANLKVMRSPINILVVVANLEQNISLTRSLSYVITFLIIPFQLEDLLYLNALLQTFIVLKLPV